MGTSRGDTWNFYSPREKLPVNSPFSFARPQSARKLSSVQNASFSQYARAYPEFDSSFSPICSHGAAGRNGTASQFYKAGCRDVSLSPSRFKFQLPLPPSRSFPLVAFRRVIKFIFVDRDRLADRTEPLATRYSCGTIPRFLDVLSYRVFLSRPFRFRSNQYFRPFERGGWDRPAGCNVAASMMATRGMAWYWLAFAVAKCWLWSRSRVNLSRAGFYDAR